MTGVLCTVYGAQVYLSLLSLGRQLFLELYNEDCSVSIDFIAFVVMGRFRNSFIHKNGNRRYKFLVLGREGPYFIKEHSDSKNKYTEDDIINMLEFLVDNIFVVFGERFFNK